MEISILDLNSFDKWNEVYSSFPDEVKDVYFSPAYYKVYEQLGYGKAYCFLVQASNNTLMYPYLKRSLNDLKFSHPYKDFFDVEGAVGINGALTKNKIQLDELIAYFNQAFVEYCAQNKIVTEFTRFNPIYENQGLFTRTQNVKVNDSVVVDLHVEDLMMKSYEHSVRKGIKKALRNDVSVYSKKPSQLDDDEIKAYLEIYQQTMDRNNARDDYYFSRNYIEALFNNLNDNVLIFFSKWNNHLISTEIVLVGGNVGYSFLGGTDSKYYDLAPNILLKHEINMELKRKGTRYFFLGGGTAPMDGIFKYKKCFAKNNVLGFYIGKKIHNQKIYQDLISLWEKHSPENVGKLPNFLTRYRL
ncbi:MAG: GNAT family N-acetyltransferase [Bacteriovoracaceae bacterium]